MTLDMHRLGDELERRSIALNNNPLRESARFVLVWLQQTIRGHDHPAIDAGVTIANQLGLPVLVYHGIRADYPHASDRLHRFLLGASREMARQLAKRGIRSAHYLDRPGHHEKGLVYRMAANAALVVVDQHVTFVGRAQSESFAQKANIGVIATDATRLVPFKALPDKGLHATKAFRAVHSPMRVEWQLMRKDITPNQPRFDGELPFASLDLANMSDRQLDALVAECPIDHSVPSSREHPADAAEVNRRLIALPLSTVPSYQRERNNPAMPNGASQLSPYLHFGMTSPWEIMRAVEDGGINPSTRYKFYDELLTWREWAHWRMQVKPQFTQYEALPSAARHSLDEHRDDTREIVSDEDLWHGRSPDETWNASQKQWLLTGWMHNNLRMYWSKQLLRWTASPEQAWELACSMNDRLSIDGRDPASYVSMRNSFGEARPGYRDIAIYGRVSPKSDTAIRKRKGMEAWIAEWAAKDVPTLSDLDSVLPIYHSLLI
jgi:deoxyribodipyrimidine photo-lyase